MKRRLLLLLAAFGLLIGGCTFAPEYIRPLAPVPDNWPQGEAYPPAAADEGEKSVAELSWEEFFTDPRLRTIIAMALENNRDLRLAALNVERAHALYGVQRAELLPPVSAAAAGGKQRRSVDLIGSGDSRTREQYSIDLGIAAWEIDFFGFLRSLKDQALEAYLATDEARRSVRISLIAEVTRIYLVLAAERENLQLAVSTLETQKASYDLVHKLFAAGVATELDLKQAQIPVETARRNLAISTQLVAQDLNALHLLAGSPVQEELLPPYLAAIASIPEISPGLSSDVLLQRPDIVAAEHRLKGTYAFIGAARAAFFPRIALTASIGTASDQLSGLFGSGADTWNFTPQIVMPIFDARTWAAYRVSETEREIALAHYEKTIQTAFREVADALAQRGTIDEQLAAQQALTDAAAESYRLSRIRYERGVDSYLAVLDSQRSLYSAQQVLIATRLARLDNLVTLYRVLGGGAM